MTPVASEVVMTKTHRARPPLADKWDLRGANSVQRMGAGQVGVWRTTVGIRRGPWRSLYCLYVQLPHGVYF